MSAAIGSTAQRLRVLKSRNLDFTRYARSLSALAGLSERDLEKQESKAERLLAMRRRIRLLEQKVRELEGHK